jgi:hypothetical protein
MIIGTTATVGQTYFFIFCRSLVLGLSIYYGYRFVSELLDLIRFRMINNHSSCSGLRKLEQRVKALEEK